MLDLVPEKRIKSIALNLFIFLASYSFFFLFKEKRLVFGTEDFKYLAIYISSWGLSSLFSRKFKSYLKKGKNSALYTYFVSFILMLGFVAGFSFLMNLDVPRIKLIFLYSIFYGFLIEIILIAKSMRILVSFSNIFSSISVKRVAAEFVLLIGIYILFMYFRMNIVHFHDYYSSILAMLFLNWFISGYISGLFKPLDFSKVYWVNIWRYLKSYIFIFMLANFISFYANFSKAEVIFIYKLVFLYSFVSLLVTTIIFLAERPRKTDNVESNVFAASEIEYGQEDVTKYGTERKFSYPVLTKYSPFLVGYDFIPVTEKMKNVYLAKYPFVFDFISQSIELNSIDVNKAIVVKSRDLYNIEVLPDRYIQLFCNLHEINDIRRINDYFIQLGKRLIPSGVFIGRMEPITLRYLRFLKTYPYYFANFFYFFDFLWTRVFPKLPGLQSLYFSLTKGKNRAISLSEGLGRLYYCGFEVLTIKQIDEYFYFIARKTGEPISGDNPSYGLIFKMKRVGKNGKLIYVYKMRTMHPYSEYLQEFIYERNQLQEGGKIKDDFRITSWGHIFRKLWIDELPMIFNLLKGELKLVGVRPLSQHFLSLYSPELREMRMRFKPGLVPPFYVDMPKTLEEIMASEMKYLSLCEKHPIQTDIIYFFKSFYNIFIKKARSA